MDNAWQKVTEAANSLFDNGFWDGLISIAVLVAGALVMLFIARRLLSVKPGMADDKAARFRVIRQVLTGVIVALAATGILYEIKPFRQLTVSLLASSGILAVIIGFASQEAVSNLVSGMFIAMFKPFVIGDRVKLVDRNLVGIVEEISLRHTVIRTFENGRIIVPNSTMNKEIVENSQFRDLKTCNFLNIGVSYGSDIPRAQAIIAEEASRHPACVDNRTPEERDAGAPIVPVRIVALEDSCVKLQAPVWSQDASSGFLMLCDLRQTLLTRFRAEGIEIPFPHVQVVQSQ